MINLISAKQKLVFYSINYRPISALSCFKTNKKSKLNYKL